MMRSIKSIHVRKLFGSYDYDLISKEESTNFDKLIILYGDNGSGKTTILKCLFYLLSPDRAKGHKSMVASIPFKSFEIVFSNGDKVLAERSDTSLVGTFSMTIQAEGEKSKSMEFISDKNYFITPTSEKMDIEIGNFLTELAGLDISLFFLSDNRTISFAGNKYFRDDSDEMILEDKIFSSDSINDNKRRRRNEIDSEYIAQMLLTESLNRAQSWIQTQILKGSSVGESSVNSLYNEILKRFTNLRKGELLQPEISKRSINERIKQLEIRSKQYAKYGFLPEFDGKYIISAISNLVSEQMPIVSNILTPYFDSIEKKLDALNEIYTEVNTFVHVINSFFKNKSIRYEMHKGFEIINESDKLLLPQTLSSGERHLLLIFLNTITAFERSSLFIIDEPEISLNIKWQRKLLTSLLECVGENPVQYIFATHSIELLAQYKDNVLKLA